MVLVTVITRSRARFVGHDEIFQIFTTQSQLLMTLKKKALENAAGKGENADNQHFLLFPQCFLLYERGKLSF